MSGFERDGTAQCRVIKMCQPSIFGGYAKRESHLRNIPLRYMCPLPKKYIFILFHFRQIIAVTHMRARPECVQILLGSTVVRAARQYIFFLFIARQTFPHRCLLFFIFFFLCQKHTDFFCRALSLDIVVVPCIILKLISGVEKMSASHIDNSRHLTL